MRHIAMSLVVVLLSLAPAVAAGQAARTPPEAQQEILKFELTSDRADHLITALAAMTKYFVSLSDYKARIVRLAKMTPTERLEAMEKDAGAMAILKQNGLTAREYSIGVPALRMAVLKAQDVDLPNIIASPANVKFAKANLATIKPKLDAIDGGAAKK